MATLVIEPKENAGNVLFGAFNGFLAGIITVGQWLQFTRPHAVELSILWIGGLFCLGAYLGSRTTAVAQRTKRTAKRSRGYT